MISDSILSSLPYAYLRHDLAVLVSVEALADLLAKVPSIDNALEQRRRAVLRVSSLREEDVLLLSAGSSSARSAPRSRSSGSSHSSPTHNVQTRIRANQVRKPQRAHRVTHTKLHSRINVLLGRHALLEEHDRLVDHGHEDSVGDETRVVVAHCHGLAACLAERLGAAEGRLVGLHGGDDLAELHLRDGVEEVDSDHARGRLAAVVGLARGTGQAREGDGRGVGAEDGGRGELGCETVHELHLEVGDLGDGLGLVVSSTV